MTERVHIRVSLNGTKPVRELMLDGVKVCELSYVEVLEAAMQFTSSLRWELEDIRAKERG